MRSWNSSMVCLIGMNLRPLLKTDRSSLDSGRSSGIVSTMYLDGVAR